MSRRTVMGMTVALPFGLSSGCAPSTRHITVYTTLARSVTQQLSTSFDALGLSVRFWRANSPEVAKRVMLEASRSIAGWDVLEVEAGLLARLSRDFHCLRRLPDTMERIEGTDDCAVARVRANCMAWNTKAVAPALVPISYADFLRPELRRKIAIVDTAVPWFYALYKHWGEARADAYFEALARQGVRASNGHSLTAELLAAGEFAISPALYDYKVATMKRAGDPVDFRFLQPISLIRSGWAINARSANVVAAEQFIRHMQGPGKKVLQDANIVAGSPSDFAAAYPDAPQQIVLSDTIDGSDEYGRWADRLRMFFKASARFS